jgi:hypothetical protein
MQEITSSTPIFHLTVGDLHGLIKQIIAQSEPPKENSVLQSDFCGNDYIFGYAGLRDRCLREECQ